MRLLLALALLFVAPLHASQVSGGFPPVLAVPPTADSPVLSTTPRLSFQRDIYELVIADLTYDLFYSDATVQYVNAGTGDTSVDVTGHAITITLGTNNTADDVFAVLGTDINRPLVNAVGRWSLTGTGSNVQAAHAAAAGALLFTDIASWVAFSDENPADDELYINWVNASGTAAFPIDMYPGVLNIAAPPVDDSTPGLITFSSKTRAAVEFHNGIITSDYTRSAPATGATLTMSPTDYALIIDPSGTLATLTVNLPLSPQNGRRVVMSSSKVVTTLTVQGQGGDTVSNAPTAFAAGQAFGFMYVLSQTKWYRIQ